MRGFVRMPLKSDRHGVPGEVVLIVVVAIAVFAMAAYTISQF